MTEVGYQFEMDTMRDVESTPAELLIGFFLFYSEKYKHQ